MVLCILYAGTIPPQLGKISSLEVLLLDNNILVGTIPPQLAQLRKLRRLNLAAQGGQQACSVVSFCAVGTAAQ
jgi:hypothetical protein